MTLDDVRLTRRGFLRLVAAATAGAFVPGLYLVVEAPAYKQPLVPGPDQYKQRHVFTPYWQIVNGGGVLSVSVLLPETVRGDAELSLFWTSDRDVEMGWWADYLEVYIGRQAKTVSPVVALPETIGTFRTLGADVVNKDSLGVFVAKPGGILTAALWAPDVCNPQKTYDSDVRIHGLDLQFEAA